MRRDWDMGCSRSMESASRTTFSSRRRLKSIERCFTGLMTRPIEVDFQMLIPAELDIRMSMGHPTEIFEVTDDIVENHEKYAHIVSDLVPFADAVAGIELAARPGVTDKVVITFDD